MNYVACLLLYGIIFHIKIINSSGKNGSNSKFDPNNNDKSNICTKEICAIESARMLNALDNSIDPCDDFYEFACGKLIRNTRLPEMKDSQTVFSEVQEIVDAQIKAILIAEPEANEPNSMKLAKIFARSCLNNGIQNENGKETLYFFLE